MSRPGEVVLVDFPYSSASGSKRRPALVLMDTGDHDLVLARITTQPYMTAHDVAIRSWKSAGLLAPSVVHSHKLVTLKKTLIRGRLGELAPDDRRRVGSVLEQAWRRVSVMLMV